MNCNDYREAIAAEPSRSVDLDAHAAGCESCANFHGEMLALDVKIAKALKIAVPDLVLPDLPSLNDNSNVINLPFLKGRRPAVPVWVGLAASIALVAVFGARFLVNDIDTPTLATAILAHLDHEPRALKVTNVAVSEQRLASVVRNDVERMADNIGLVTFATTCVINGNKIPHLVIQGAKGPITLLLLPDEFVDSAMTIDGIGIDGVILPVGKGSIAIVGERGESLADLENELINSVKWKI